MVFGYFILVLQDSATKEAQDDLKTDSWLIKDYEETIKVRM
jgi:hypothetical protein